MSKHLMKCMNCKVLQVIEVKRISEYNLDIERCERCGAQSWIHQSVGTVRVGDELVYDNKEYKGQ